jgi:hypothetical protein
MIVRKAIARGYAETEPVRITRLFDLRDRDHLLSTNLALFGA